MMYPGKPVVEGNAQKTSVFHPLYSRQSLAARVLIRAPHIISAQFALESFLHRIVLWLKLKLLFKVQFQSPKPLFSLQLLQLMLTILSKIQLLCRY